MSKAIAFLKLISKFTTYPYFNMSSTIKGKSLFSLSSIKAMSSAKSFVLSMRLVTFISVLNCAVVSVETVIGLVPQSHFGHIYSEGLKKEENKRDDCLIPLYC